METQPHANVQTTSLLGPLTVTRGRRKRPIYHRIMLLCLWIVADANVQTTTNVWQRVPPQIYIIRLFNINLALIALMNCTDKLWFTAPNSLISITPVSVPHLEFEFQKSSYMWFSRSPYYRRWKVHPRWQPEWISGGPWKYAAHSWGRRKVWEMWKKSVQKDFLNVIEGENSDDDNNVVYSVKTERKERARTEKQRQSEKIKIQSQSQRITRK